MNPKISPFVHFVIVFFIFFSLPQREESERKRESPLCDSSYLSVNEMNLQSYLNDRIGKWEDKEK